MTRKILSQIDADGNATVMLNRPEAHNAFDPEMVDALTATFTKLEADARVRAVVITSTSPNFCAGADIEHMKRSAKFSRAQNLESARATATMLNTLYTLEKPTIACVRGAVRGGGVGLVSACDIAIAARTATFRFSEVKLGIIPAMISPYVIAAMGVRHARRFMISGEEFDSAEAFRTGLVHDICEEDELNAKVGRMLGHLYSSGPGAIVAIKKLITEVAGAPINEPLVEKTAQRIAQARTTTEAQEGLSAFLEKRKAAWSTPAPEAKSGKKK
ncbi:MAG: enoyl-CoA hydratase/isomerase family protein [Betaproteobacteria bacterium]|nr:enoyl-CoA hydratase/isomerase family protein [Betaproteobacteria bacterium]